MADHNDPNAVNTIFSDIDVSAADLYDLFGFPSDDAAGREEAYFNDLPGFFRSINYAPQFYHVPHSMTDARELPIPKTLLELEGNHLFNFDPATPDWGKTMKKDLPPGPWTWTGDEFKKDE